MEKVTKMAAKFYECRDAAKSLAKIKGVDYKEYLSPYIKILTDLMSSEKLTEINALLKISKTPIYKENSIAAMLFIASVVEIIEPS